MGSLYDLSSGCKGLRALKISEKIKINEYASKIHRATSSLYDPLSETSINARENAEELEEKTKYLKKKLHDE